MESYAQMLEYIESTVCCEIKTYDEMCGWAHYDPGVAKGGSCCLWSISTTRQKKILVLSMT